MLYAVDFNYGGEGLINAIKIKETRCRSLNGQHLLICICNHYLPSSQLGTIQNLMLVKSTHYPYFGRKLKQIIITKPKYG